MKSRCLLNSCNSTSQFISIMFRYSCFCLFVCLFFYMITHISRTWSRTYICMTLPLLTTHFSWPLPFLSLEKLWPSLCFHPPPPPPPANFGLVHKSYRVNTRGWEGEGEGGCWFYPARNIKHVFFFFFTVSLFIRRGEEIGQILQEKIPMNKSGVDALEFEGKKKSSRCSKQRFRQL